MTLYPLREDIADGQQGRIATANEQNRRLNVDVWMPKPSTAANNTANLKAAIADATSGGVGRTLYIPPGTYTLDDIIPINDVSGLRVVGSGNQTVLVSTRNAPTRALFELSDVRESVFRDFWARSLSPLFALFRLRSKAGGGTPSFNLLDNLALEGRNNIACGVNVGGGEEDTGSIDANNDFNVFRRLYVTGYTLAGAHLRGYAGSAQSYGNQFENCLFYGGTGAHYAVSAGGNYPGNFSWNGGFVGLHNTADFIIGRSYQPYLIRGVNSEVSARFLIIENAAHTQVGVYGSRYAANALHADGRAIIASGRYKAHFELNRFGDGTNGVPIKFDFNTTVGGTTQSWVKFTGNDIYSSEESVFTNGVPTLEGNFRIPNEATHASVPLTA